MHELLIRWEIPQSGNRNFRTNSDEQGAANRILRSKGHQFTVGFGWQWLPLESNR